MTKQKTLRLDQFDHLLNIQKHGKKLTWPASNIILSTAVRKQNTACTFYR